MKKQSRIVIIAFLIIASVLLFEKVMLFSETVSETSLRPKVIEYKAEGLKDPFRGKEPEVKKEVVEEPVQKKPLPVLTVRGLVWGGNIPQAIINNKVVKIGDTIEGVRIVSIAKDGVKVLFENQEYNLSSPAVSNLKTSKKPQEGGKNEK